MSGRDIGVLVPAFGRDYASGKAAREAFLSGDHLFVIANMFSAEDGRTIGVSDCAPGDRVRLRFKRLTGIVSVVVPDPSAPAKAERVARAPSSWRVEFRSATPTVGDMLAHRAPYQWHALDANRFRTRREAERWLSHHVGQDAKPERPGPWPHLPTHGRNAGLRVYRCYKVAERWTHELQIFGHTGASTDHRRLHSAATIPVSRINLRPRGSRV